MGLQLKTGFKTRKHCAQLTTKDHQKKDQKKKDFQELNQPETTTLLTSQRDHSNTLLQMLNTGYNDFSDNQHEHLSILVHCTMESTSNKTVCTNNRVLN